MLNCSNITFIFLIMLILFLILVHYKETFTSIARYNITSIPNSTKGINKTEYEERLLNKIVSDNLFLKKEDLLTVSSKRVGNSGGDMYSYLLYRQNTVGGPDSMKHWYGESPVNYTMRDSTDLFKSMQDAAQYAADNNWLAFYVDPLILGKIRRVMWGGPGNKYAPRIIIGNGWDIVNFYVLIKDKQNPLLGNKP